jgi:hypothetical protein
VSGGVPADVPQRHEARLLDEAAAELIEETRDRLDALNKSIEAETITPVFRSIRARARRQHPINRPGGWHYSRLHRDGIAAGRFRGRRNGALGRWLSTSADALA